MSISRPRRGKRPAAPERLSAPARREQLLRTAAELLGREGIDGLELTRLASEAGVSRPIVYRFFPSRQALIISLLEDLEVDLGRRFALAAAGASGGVEEVTRAFVDAVCDAIEAKGVGPWELLGSRGPDPEVARIALAIHVRLLAPWHAVVARATGATRREAEVASRMLVAAGRAALELWYAGATTRDRAARDATRGVSAILGAFAKR